MHSSRNLLSRCNILSISQRPVQRRLMWFHLLWKSTRRETSKAAGVDGIQPAIWRHGGPVIHMLLVCCWEKGRLPQDLRDAWVIIITLYKKKRVKGLSVWTITLLSLEGKILVRVVSGTPALTPPTVSAYVAEKEPALLGPSGPAVDLWRFLFILLFRYSSYSFGFKRQVQGFSRMEGTKSRLKHRHPAS